MSLDLPTLFIVSSCIAGLLGLFLFFASRIATSSALAWWGAAYMLGGVGVAMWIAEAAEVSNPPFYGLSNAMLFAACATTGTVRACSMGARCCPGRSRPDRSCGSWLVRPRFSRNPAFIASFSAP